MQWRRSWTGSVAALAVAVGTVVAVPGGVAHAWPIEETFSITATSATYGNRLYTPENSRISVTQSNQVEQQLVSVAVLRGDVPEMTFDFSSRDGSRRYLEVGHYDHAQRYPFTDPGRPGISVGPMGFCNTESGDFEVRDIQHEGLAITRLWITYRRLCDGGPAVVGELRLGYPEADLDTSPRVVRRPDGTYPGRAGHDVPVAVFARVPAEVTSVRVVGAHAADFPVRGNGCAGRVPETGCVVHVGFTPSAPGPRHAALEVSTTAGVTAVSLDGTGALGASTWTLDIDHEDPSRADEHLDLRYSASRGGPYEFQSQAFEADGSLWNASFDLAGNETFARGRYTANPDGTGLRMSLARGNAGCEIDQAAVDVADIGFTGPDDELALLDMTMTVHCRAAYGSTVRGRLRFHDRDDLTAPAGVTDLRATRAGDSVTLAWTGPAEADVAGVLVRWYPGGTAPTATDAGHFVHIGPGGTAGFDAPAAAAVSVWTYDRSGNVGPRAEVLA